MLPKDHPDAVATVSPSGYSKLLVYETVTEGGFGKLLNLEDGAMLDLGHFEQGKKNRVQPPGPANAQSSLNTDVNSDRPILDKNGISEIPALPPPVSSESREGRSRRKFTSFHFRKKTSQGNRSAAGPALAVMDMGQEQNGHEGEQESAGSGMQGQAIGGGDGAMGTGNNGSGEGRSKKDMDEGKGVRVMIRLAALDEMGTELMSPNEQVTYLHVVRFGMKDPSVEEGSAEDSRPWVVKVVKREATVSVELHLDVWYLRVIDRLGLTHSIYTKFMA